MKNFWGVFAVDSTPSHQQARCVPVVPPPVIAISAGLAQHLLAPKNRPKSAGRTVAAGAIAAGAAAFDLTAVEAFRRHHTTVNPLNPSKATSIVQDGPFAVTRNPMYVGMAGFLLAHAALRGGWKTLLPIAGFVAVIDRVQIPPEEAAMEQLFGEKYADYRSRVPRWLGPIG